MKKTFLLSALGAAVAASLPMRAVTNDVAFQFRMGGGTPGDVNRNHPASVVPGLIDSGASKPINRYGDPVLFSTASNYRRFDTGDTAVTKVNGVLVRPYPVQGQSSTNYGAQALGAATPPTSGIQDILESGFIMTQIPTGQTVKKGDAVYVWCAADSGSHKQGGFENAASGGNTAAVTNAIFWGPADSNGVVEVRVFN